MVITGPLFSDQRTTKKKTPVTEILLPVQIYLISKSLWPDIRANKKLHGHQSSQCNEVFVNEKGEGRNTDLIMDSVPP